MNDNSKFNNLGFKKWLEIIASGDLPTKLRKSENGGLKSNANSGEEREQETWKTAAKPSTGDRGTKEYSSYTGDSNSLQPLHSLLLMGHPPQSFARFCDSRISSILLCLLYQSQSIVVTSSRVRALQNTVNVWDHMTRVTSWSLEQFGWSAYGYYVLLSRVYTSTGAEARKMTWKKGIMSMQFVKNIFKNTKSGLIK